MNDLVFAQNGQVLTNSLTISDVFDKRHTDVMRSIKSLEIPEDLRQRNFAQTFKIVKMPNGAQRKDPVFNLTKDGFVLLVMGFTGKKAMEFKIKYIEAFNAMERALSAPKTDKSVLVVEHTRALPSGKREIVLSEKAKQEIGGIVKAVVAKTLADFFAPDAEQHPSGMPFANWALSAVHDIGAMKSEYDALKNRVAQAQNILK